MVTAHTRQHTTPHSNTAAMPAKPRPTSPAPYAVLASGILSDAAAASTLGYSFSVVPTCSNFSMRFSPNSNNSSAGTDSNQKTKVREGLC
jgi:hypothetical protein